jgi:hypothetical protein
MIEVEDRVERAAHEDAQRGEGPDLWRDLDAFRQALREWTRPAPAQDRSDFCDGWLGLTG